MSKHVRPGQKPASLQKERKSRLAQEQPQPQERRLLSYGGAWRLFIRQETRGKRSSDVQPLAKLGRSCREPGEEERPELQRKGQEGTERRMRGESFTSWETRRAQQMRAKKHLRAAALEAMSQEKRAGVDEIAVVHEVAVVQEHSLQSMSRVAQPGTGGPITIWARLQALKRTFVTTRPPWTTPSM